VASGQKATSERGFEGQGRWPKGAARPSEGGGAAGDRLGQRSPGAVEEKERNLSPGRSGKPRTKRCLNGPLEGEA